MTREHIPSILALFGILGAIALGLVLRLDDPLSSPVIPAEDPYNHMALVREHLRDGSIDPLNPGAGLYPPGMHAFLASTWAFTGLGLYEIFRIGPVVFGAIGVLGAGVFAHRAAGPLAGVFAAGAMAVTPELIFRTTMMSPTAMDLAILPFLFYLILGLAHGKLAWAWPTGVTLLFLVFAHPWVLAILALSLILFTMIAMAVPARHGAWGRVSARGLALVLALCGTAMALAIWGCSGTCGPGLNNVGSVPGASLLLASPWIVLAIAMVPLAVFAAPRRMRRALVDRPVTWSTHLVAATLAVAVATFVALVTINGYRGGLPEFVDPQAMFGTPFLLFAAVGLGLAFWIRDPGVYLAASFGLVPYPFVYMDAVGAWFLPHRSAVFLGVGIVLLAGITAAVLVRMAARGSSRLHAWWIRRRGAEHARSTRITWVTASVVAGTMLGASVVAATPEPYPGGWYRLYPECEFDALRDISQDAGTDTVIIAGSWQAKLVMAAFSDDASQVWFDQAVFHDEDTRAGSAGGLAQQGKDTLVVVDRHMIMEQRGTDWSYFEDEGWTLEVATCSSNSGEDRVIAYRHDGGVA